MSRRCENIQHSNKKVAYGPESVAFELVSSALSKELPALKGEICNIFTVLNRIVHQK